MAEVKAVCISERKGTMKHEVPEIHVKIKHGIEGDAHAGDWHRQISLLGTESVVVVLLTWVLTKLNFQLTVKLFTCVLPMETTIMMVWLGTELKRQLPAHWMLFHLLQKKFG